jgi:hypothetical protein
LFGLSALASSSAAAQPCSPGQTSCQLPSRSFRVHAYSGTIVRNDGKCLDYAAAVSGSPIFLNDCSVAHSFDVTELVVPDEGNPGRSIRNRVRLMAGGKVVGVRRATIGDMGLGGSPTSPPSSEPVLELQNVAGSGPKYGPNFGALGPSAADQIFALDGDSIMLAHNRELVAKVKNGRGANGTPIVIGSRSLEESELWDFRASDGSNELPTAGFIRLPATLSALSQYLLPTWAAPLLDYGTVLVLEEMPIFLSAPGDGPPDELATPFETMLVPAGVTLRGDRRATRSGPELWMRPGYKGLLFEIRGSDARITGLRLRGPTRSHEQLASARGILVRQHDLPVHIDHNDLSDWPRSAVEIGGDTDSLICAMPPELPDKIDNVLVTRNFIHDNQRENLGYGVSVGGDFTGTVWGNTFVRNRHAIAADGTARSGYAAWFNLVMSDAPYYGWGSFEHDFDMHGKTGDPDDTHHYGGVAGDYVSIAWNTFLGDNRYNYALRGEPCGSHYFHHNVTVQESDDAVYDNDDVETNACPSGYPQYANGTLSICHNHFDSANPTDRLGVGDFDGDGLADLFLATGAAWYFAPAGRAEWRFLAGGRTDRIEDLLFGDFDGDGRTDVAGKNGNQIMVSWGGSSGWEVLNTTAAPMTDLAAGNFDGGDRDDLFHADGQSWFLSSGGSSPFLFRNTSSKTVSDVRFGDFNGNGTTDVFAIVGNPDAFGAITYWWQFSEGASSAWHPLQPRLTDIVDELVIADFDGDHRDDVAIREPLGLATWRFSLAGISSWVELTAFEGDVAGVGRFRGQEPAEMVGWDGRYLWITGFQMPEERYSTQDMR